jgi:hypothetical protein
MKVFVVVALFFIGSLLACSAAEDMAGMFDKQDIVKEYLQKEHGLTAQLGFQIHNGQLLHVTIIFESEEVNDRKVSELQEIAFDAAAANFESMPKAVIVQVSKLLE